MTRSNDKYVSLDDRNIKGAFISIHNDALDSSNANGVTVYWFKKKARITCTNFKFCNSKEGIIDKSRF